MEFAKTVYGKRLLERDIPAIAEALQGLNTQGGVVLTKYLPEINTSLHRIADALEDVARSVKERPEADINSQIPDSHIMSDYSKESISKQVSAFQNLVKKHFRPSTDKDGKADS